MSNKKKKKREPRFTIQTYIFPLDHIPASAHVHGTGLSVEDMIVVSNTVPNTSEIVRQIIEL